MRTIIEIDDELMARAMRESGAKTKKAVVEEALKMLVSSKAPVGIRKLRGKVTFYDDIVEANRLAGLRNVED